MLAAVRVFHCHCLFFFESIIVRLGREQHTPVRGPTLEPWAPLKARVGGLSRPGGTLSLYRGNIFMRLDVIPRSGKIGED